MPYKDPDKARAAARRSYRKNRLKRLARHKEYYEDNREACLTAKRKYRHEWYKNEPERQLYYGAKKRAKQKGLEFDLEKSDIVIPEMCPVLGIPIRVNKGKVEDDSPTLDRIDNNRGYTKDNVIVVCCKANRIKGNASVDELERVYEFYRDL